MRLINNLKEFFVRVRKLFVNISGETSFGKDTRLKPEQMQMSVKIGNTTYLVSSFFKKDSKYNVLDKIARLIERDSGISPDNQ